MDLLILRFFKTNKEIQTKILQLKVGGEKIKSNFLRITISGSAFVWKIGTVDLGKSNNYWNEGWGNSLLIYILVILGYDNRINSELY